MGKKEKLAAKLKAENPTLTNEQIEDLIAENEASLETLEDGDDELDKIAEEKAALAKEREVLKKEKAELEKAKAELLSASAAKPVKLEKPKGETQLYKCITACTFKGIYYREGDELETDEETPEFFIAIGK